MEVMLNDARIKQLVDADRTGVYNEEVSFSPSRKFKYEFGIGNIKVPELNPVIERAFEMAWEQQNAVTLYGGTQGITEVIDLAARLVSETSGIPISRERVLLTNGGTTDANAAVFSMNQGYKTLLDFPAYVYFSALALNDNRAAGVASEGGYDFCSELEKAVFADEDIKLYVAQFPKNPTGRLITRGEAVRIREIADQHGVAILEDGVYDHFVPDKKKITPYLRPDFISGSLAKWGFPGLEFGYLAIPHAEENELSQLMKAARTVAGNGGAGISSPTAALGYALMKLHFEGGEYDPISIIKKSLDAKREPLKEAFNNAGIVFSSPDYSLYWTIDPQKSFGLDSETAVKKLRENGTNMLPGTKFFGGFPRYMDFIRVCIGVVSLEEIESLHKELPDIVRKIKN